MPSRTTIDQNAYLSVTPAGAFFAIASQHPAPERTLLRQILARSDTPQIAELEAPDGLAAQAQGSDGLAGLIDLGWISLLMEQETAPLMPLEQLLPKLLVQLSDNGRALLADQQGLQIANAGFAERDAAGLAALSADANALAHRCAMLLPELAASLPRAWATVDAAGNSQIGVWPIHLPERQFALIIEGRPLINRQAFKHLIWSLMRRYGS
jgi:hypothetical protein